MCFPVECPYCRKVSWSGCGQHVESVMARVPEERQCKCR